MAEETTFNAQASPQKVWSVLADLAGYALWHPHYRFSLMPLRRRDGLVSWNFLDDYRVKLLLHEQGGDKPGVWAWRAGRRGLLTIEDRYEIAPVANGVTVHHLFACRGIVGMAYDAVNRAEIRANMAAQDAALLQYLKRVLSV